MPCFNTDCSHILSKILLDQTRPILKIKGMDAIFQKNGKKMLKKYLGRNKNLGRNLQIWKYVEKGQVIACDNHIQKNARTGTAKETKSFYKYFW